MPTPRIPIRRLLVGLVLATLAAPVFAEGCQEETYSCPNNAGQCRWMSCIENGTEVYFYKKWCDGWVQEIQNGMADVRLEEPCVETGGGGDEQDDNEGHVRHKYGF